MSKISDITETEFLVLEIAPSSAPGASKLLQAVVYGHEKGHVLTEFFNVIDEISSVVWGRLPYEDKITFSLEYRTQFFLYDVYKA